MATWRTIVYEKLSSLKKDFDDSDLLLNQIIYYATLAVNTTMLQHLSKTESNAYLAFFDVNVTKGTGNGWYEFDLPQGIFDLDKDKGINFVAYSMKDKGKWLCVPFQWIRHEKLWRTRKSPYECPSPSNPYFARLGNKVLLYGVETITLSTVSVGLYVTVPVDAVIDLDEEIPLDEAHLYFAVQLMDTLLKWAMVLTPEKYNDGSDLSEKFNQLENMFKQQGQANQQENEQSQRQQSYQNRS